MQKNSRQPQVRTKKVLVWPSRIKSLTGVLGAALFLAALHNPMTALGVVAPPNSVTLAWDASPSAGVAGYRVYYGTASGNYTSNVEAGNLTTNTIPGMVNGTTYYFAVKAYNASGLEGAFSNEISFVPGTATVQIMVAANGQAVLTLKGLIGHTYDVQATPDLKNWSIIGSATIGAGGSFAFTDVNAPSFAKRFYRLRDTQP